MLTQRLPRARVVCALRVVGCGAVIRDDLAASVAWTNWRELTALARDGAHARDDNDDDDMATRVHAVAEHLVTGHKVAVKILNRAKILALDMGEKVRRRIGRFFSH